MLVRYEYDRHGRLITSFDRANHARRYEYNADHLLTKETNRLGGSFYFEYDASKRCVHNFGDGGFMERRLVYDDDSLTTTVYDTYNRATIYQRDEVGRVTSITNPSGATTQKVYDVTGQLALIIEPLAQVTAYEYDEMGNLASITYPDGGVQKWTYNDQHLPVSMVKPSGALWKWSYTQRGALQSMTDPVGAVWQYGWGNDNLIDELIAPNGHKTVFKADKGWRWFETSDEEPRSRVEFDRFGFVTAVYDAVGLKRRYTLDQNNQLVAVEESEGVTHLITRDAQGNLTSIRHPGDIGSYYRVRYDRFGNMTERIDPLGQVASWTYDSEGRLAEITNEKGESASFTYDAQGLLIQQVFFDGHAEIFERDAAGRPVAVSDGEGRITRFKWDGMRRVTERTFPDGTVESYSYDKVGNLIGGKNSDCEIEFEYDLLGRLLAEGCDGHRVEYEYDLLGNMTLQHHLQGQAGPQRFAYDARGRMTAVMDSNGVVQEFEYDSLDRPIRRKLDDGVWEHLEYNKRRKLSRQAVTGPGGTVIDRRYEYNALDNIVFCADNRWGETRYRYDGNEQIIEEVQSTFGPSRFSYDACGNLEQGPDGKRVYGSGGRLLSAPGKKYDYDANGSLASVREAGGQTRLRYDGARRLREIIHADGRRTTYSYDALGRRISKTLDGRKTRFVWATDDLAAEYTEGQDSKEYLMLGFRPIVQWQGGKKYGCIVDQTFDVSELIGSDGSLAWSGNYGVLGQLRVERAPEGRTCLRAAGRYADDESGLYYNRFRYFDPFNSRFTSVDPFRTSRRLNHYWAGPSVVNWIDPLGLECGKPACGEIGVDKDGVYTDPAGRKYTNGVPENVKSIVLDTGESRGFPARVRRAINQIGDRDGCSTCPARDPGTTPGVAPREPGEPLGNWVPDHDPPVTQGGPPYRGRPQ
jgi:RHS repeat-associated protein